MERQKVVVLDDYEPNLRMYSTVIERAIGHQVVAFSDPALALHYLGGAGAALCVVDFNMPKMDGVEFVQTLRAIPGRERVPIIMLTGSTDGDIKRRATTAGVNVFLTKPISAEEFGAHVKRLAAIQQERVERADEMRDLKDRVDSVERRLYAHDAEALRALFRAYAARDTAAARRMQQAADIAVQLAIECRCSAQEVETLRDCAFVYDIGKLAVGEKILTSPVALSPKSKSIAESHAEVGASILAPPDSKLFAAAAKIARSHHERWDGGGYPGKVAQEAIAMGARIVAVADALVALTHDRADRRALAFGHALDQIRRESGTHFDPTVVAALEKIKDRIGALVTAP